MNQEPATSNPPPATKILVTGAIGFIGYHLTLRLLNEGFHVIGIDNINSYYDVRLKYSKLPNLGIADENLWPNVIYQSSIHPGFQFAKLDIKNRFQVEELFRKEQFDVVVNLAAQAGVQYSIKNPHTYIENNITGFINLIDAAKTHKVKHFVYASSSSVYGNRDDVPFSEDDNVDNPISLYAASKKSNELMAHTYSHLYGLKTTGLRFFTVYGPWGRPDMAPFIFMKRIQQKETITVYNNADMERDFTYVDDVVEGVYRVVRQKAETDDVYNVFNIGNSSPVNLGDFIKTIEEIVGKKAIIDYKPIREGDVFKTYSDSRKIMDKFEYKPTTDIKTGLSHFFNWYKEYYEV